MVGCGSVLLYYFLLFFSTLSYSLEFLMSALSSWNGYVLIRTSSAGEPFCFRFLICLICRAQEKGCLCLERRLPMM